VTVGILTVVRRTFNKGSLRTRKAKLGKKSASVRTRLDTLFCGLYRDKTYPSISRASTVRTRGLGRTLGGDDGPITATVSAQFADQH